ncbi:MAG: glycosyltransferase [Candidatus Kryptoniota bacterium]
MIYLFVLLALAGASYYIFCLVSASVKTDHGKKVKGGNLTENDQPPVSILKPLSNGDGNLYENLLTFVKLDYKEFEILIGVQNADDPALEVARKLQKEFPDRDISIIESTENVGFNPKVNNLYALLRRARYDHVVISDSNVSVGKDYLRENVKYLADNSVGIVTNPIRGIGGKSLGATFENLHLNSFVMGSVSFLSFLNHKIVIGKSIFFRKSQLDAIGGLKLLANYLAEDYLMGKIYQKHGYKVILSPYVINTVNVSWTISKFLGRHSRWAKLRWNLNKFGYIGELISNFVFVAFISIFATGFSYGSFSLLYSAILLKIAGDYIINRKLHSGLSLKDAALSPLKDLLIGIIWPLPLFSTHTVWRGNRLKITKNTILVTSQGSTLKRLFGSLSNSHGR